MIDEKLRDLTYNALKEMDVDFDKENIIIEIPRNTDNGDYSTNISFILAKQLKKSPKLIAEEIVATISGKSNICNLTSVNGFINFTMSDSFLHSQIVNIDEDFGSSIFGNEEKVLVEFVSANPTGPLHIGHGRWAAIGDCVVRMLNKIGYKADSEFYINDAGNQINNFRASVDAVKNGKPVPENGYHGAYVNDLATSDSDPVETMLTEQKNLLTDFRCEFDRWFSETTLHDSNEVNRLLDVIKEKGVTYEKDGALWFRSTDYGDEKDRVLVRDNGIPTYFAADIAYHYNKIQRGYDRIIDIWGADHHGYIARVRASLDVLFGNDLKEKGKNIDDLFTVVIGQLVRLFRSGKEVRMSKRTGEMISLDEVNKEIGTDASRYFLAMRSCDQMLDFDLDLAKQQSSDNPVYYVQYAYARICSILRKKDFDGKVEGDIALEPEERKLLLLLMKYPNVVMKAATSYSPYMLAQYAQDLASGFHSFYSNCRVITDDASVMSRRFIYIKKLKEVLKDSLYLLGVEAPEKM